MQGQFPLTRAQLLALGTGALLATASTGVAASSTAFQFDQARFADILGRPARHRQCCASTKAEWGVLDAMLSTMYAYEVDLREGPGTVHEVAVLYHQAGIVLALDDGVWNDLLLPALPHLSSYVRDALNGLSTKGNPFLHRRAGTPATDDPTIEALVSRGCHFFVCNNAMLGLSDSLATALHETSDRIHERLLDGLVPGAMAVPAGVMAINACQEAHFTYLQATL